MPEGPFAKLFKMISLLQNEYSLQNIPVRMALISPFNSPALSRVIYSLRAWDVRLDEAFYIGEAGKEEVLRAFGANISFNG